LIETGTGGPAPYSAVGALLSDQNGDLDKAIKVLKAGYQKYPRDSSIANNLAYVHLMRGEPAEARQILEKLSSEEIASSVFLTATWGLLRLWEGDISNAVRYYSAAQGLARQRGRPRLAQTARQKMHLELARHFLRLGDGNRASAEAKQGLSVGGSTKYKEELRVLRDRLLSAPDPEKPTAEA
jgi:tetratricopeptide (TPR) repeat protein